MTAHDDAKSILAIYEKQDYLVSGKDWKRLVTRMVNEHQELLDDSADYKEAYRLAYEVPRSGFTFTVIGSPLLTITTGGSGGSK